MHIEPGFVSAAKVAAANVACAGLLLGHVATACKNPSRLLADAVRTVLAALFFSLFMESFHLPVGPSELHFVGAMPIYLVFGYLPTLLGFGLGLLLQGLLFEPQDLVHLGVNTLSLAVPLTLVHFARRRQPLPTTVAGLLKLDAAYYTGVTLMVGFWLAIGETATPFAAWAAFAASYIPVVLIEPVFTLAIVKGLAPHAGHPALRLATALKSA